jgi:tetratricopeptide (TPR) repeat protein
MAGRRRTSSTTGSGHRSAKVLHTADIARILRLPDTRVRALARAGLCQPLKRGGMYEFSFQDLVLLRAAHGLLRNSVPLRKVRRSLRELSRQLPADRPLSGVRIYADGKSVVVRDGNAAWQPDSGQAVFTFKVDDLAKKSGVLVQVAQRRGRVTPRKREQGTSAMAWFERGLALEEVDVTAATTAYRRALERDPELSDAYINLGRLLHESGDTGEAMRLYAEAIKRAPDDPVAHYDMALALEDQGDPQAAKRYYHRALELEPDFADAHYNLGRLLDQLGQRAQALRHLLAYKRLTDSS